MGLHVRFQYPTGSALGYSIERLSDGLFYDYGDSTFKLNPVTWIRALIEGTGIFVGRYSDTLTPTPSNQFTDGEYCISIHDTANNNTIVGQLSDVMHAGDDAPVFPGIGSGVDPLTLAVPGSYPPGSAGYELAQIRARVDSVSGPSGTVAASPAPSRTSFKANESLGLSDDVYKDQFLVFTRHSSFTQGSGQFGRPHVILSHTGDPPTFVFSAPGFPRVPEAGDSWEIIGIKVSN